MCSEPRTRVSRRTRVGWLHPLTRRHVAALRAATSPPSMGGRGGLPCLVVATRSARLERSTPSNTSPPYLGERSDHLTFGEVVRVRGLRRSPITPLGEHALPSQRRGFR